MARIDGLNGTESLARLPAGIFAVHGWRLKTGDITADVTIGADASVPHGSVWEEKKERSRVCGWRWAALMGCCLARVRGEAVGWPR